MANSTDPTTERSLRERFRLAILSAEEGMTIIEGGRVVCVNDRVGEIFGYSRSELARMTDLDLAAPEEKKRLRRTVLELRKQRRLLEELEFWVLRKDGGRRYVRNRYIRESGGDGIARLVVLTADLTEQQRTQQVSILPKQEPLRQQPFLGQILDASPNLVYVKDRDGRFVMVNQRYAEAFGRQPQDFVGKDNLEMGWPKELAEGSPTKGIPGIWAEERELVESGQPQLIPRERVWVGGRWRLMSTVHVPLRDAEGEVWGFVGFARDAVEPEQPSAQAEMLYNVSQALAAASDPEEMLQSVAEPAMKSGAHVAILMHVDVDAEGQPEWAEVVAVIGETAATVGARFYVRDSAQAALLHASSEQPLLVGDIGTAQEGINEAVLRDMQSIQAYAFALVPLRVAGHWQGVLTLAWPRAHDFSSEEERLYSLLGAQLAASIQRKRLRQEAEHRAVWSQTAAEVSSAAATILTPDELLQRAVDLIHERFDLYYAGLFLVGQNGGEIDEPGEWAVLRVGTGEAGRKMVEMGHKLEIGGASMIGQCLSSKKPRIAMDVGKEAVHFANPLLPDTRTELALPLISRGQALGALTIQSTQPAAFSADDIAVLQTMTDQLAIAIDNANLIVQARAQAERERRVRDITEKIHRAADTEVIMRIALQELSQMLGASKAVIRLGTRVQLEAESGKSSTATE
jgi:PAS domain S-box-containing protein